MKPLHGAGDVLKAQKHDVELVIAGGDVAKDFYALKKVSHQVASLVVVLVQDARVFLRLPRQTMMTSMARAGRAKVIPYGPSIAQGIHRR